MISAKGSKHARIGTADLILDKYRSQAIEELKGSEDTALDENTGDDCGGSPDARADGHLVEPLFERQLAYLATEHVGHDPGCAANGAKAKAGRRQGVSG